MEWIKDNHLPEVHVSKHTRTHTPHTHTHTHIHTHACAYTHIQIVLQYAFQGAKAKPTVANIDYQTLSQAYVNIVAGCCMGMGLCYAGTGDGRARECLVLNYYQGRNNSQTQEPKMSILPLIRHQILVNVCCINFAYP